MVVPAVDASHCLSYSRGEALPLPEGKGPNPLRSMSVALASLEEAGLLCRPCEGL